MKSYPRLLCGALALTIAASSALAQTQNIGRIPNYRTWGDVYTTSTQTFSSTTPTVVTGGSVVNTTAFDPGMLTFGSPGTNGASSVYTYDHLRVWWTADVSKATSTTGSCEVYLNGTAIARSLRTSNFAGSEDTIGGMVDLSYTGVTSPADPFNVGTPKQVQTVALYCFSGDTAAFSVFRTQLHIEEAF